MCKVKIKMWVKANKSNAKKNTGCKHCLPIKGIDVPCPCQNKVRLQLIQIINHCM